MRWLAGAGGVLLFVALFLPWYTYDNARTERELRAVGERDGDLVLLVALTDPGGSAWFTFTVVDILLALAAALVIAAALVPRLRLVAAAVATGGVALVVFRLLDHAGPTRYEWLAFYPSPAIGAWLALAGALIAAAAGWASLRRGS